MENIFADADDSGDDEFEVRLSENLVFDAYLVAFNFLIGLGF